VAPVTVGAEFEDVGFRCPGVYGLRDSPHPLGTCSSLTACVQQPRGLQDGLQSRVETKRGPLGISRSTAGGPLHAGLKPLPCARSPGAFLILLPSVLVAARCLCGLNWHKRVLGWCGA
jgi:hypothetical protein